MSGLDGTVAVVTGAGEGIGLGIARRFARDRAVVVIAEVNSATGQAAAETLSSEFGVTARFIVTDVIDRGAVESMIDETIGAFGRVDVLPFTPAYNVGKEALRTLARTAARE